MAKKRGEISTMLTNLSTAGFATSSRYAVSLALPKVLTADKDFMSDFRNIDGLKRNRLINFYADSISTPTKQVTTAQHRTHGVGINYPTGTVYGEVTLNLLSPENLDFNRLFESWYQKVHLDYGNVVQYYEDCISKEMIIYSLEKNGKDSSYNVTGRWEIYGALPYNISPYQFSSGRTQLLKMRVSFKVERYRFLTGGRWSEIKGLFNY